MEYTFDKLSDKQFNELSQILKGIDTIVIISQNGDRHVYENIHKTSISTTYSSVDVIQSRGIYFRSWYERDDNYRDYSSHIVDIYNTCDLVAEEDVLTIIIGKGVVFGCLSLWERKPPSEYISRSRVTKDVAQMRMDDLGYDFTVVSWENTSKPATVVCNICEKEIEFKRGSSIYTVNEYGGFKGQCSECRRYEYALSNIQTYKESLNTLKEKLNNGKVCEDDFLDKKENLEQKIEKESNIINSYVAKTKCIYTTSKNEKVVI